MKAPNGHVTTRFSGSRPTESPLSSRAALYSRVAPVPATKWMASVSFKRWFVATVIAPGSAVVGVVHSTSAPAGTTVFADAPVATIVIWVPFVAL